MLSLPEDWDDSINGLEKILKEGRDCIMTTLQELEEYKYLRRDTYRNNKGQYECTYNIYELPQLEENNEETQLEKPSRENRVGFSDSDNPTQINTNNKINKISTNKDNNYKVLTH